MECMVQVCPISASYAILEAMSRWRVKAVCEHHKNSLEEDTPREELWASGWQGCWHFYFLCDCVYPIFL